MSYRQSSSIFFCSQKGFTLIETLVASLLLTLGVLAFISLQIRSLQSTQSAGQNTQSTVLTNDIIDSARANLEGLEAGAYNTPFGKVKDKIITIPSCSPCTPEALAQQDLARWFERIEKEFSGASVGISYETPELSITLEWPSQLDETIKRIITLRVCTQEILPGGTEPCFI